ncbi:hypothetical protein DICPUDRAFT_81233 [Dictyostelium purpureum]|uniref:DNA-directed RNA polymerase III subunit n=1 Tax=Dictyostelium purpureum TaxID=5786 RepID=F0ZSV9_DICPU|nr:uncharacterized protein DICPUDRAFT_81233 [Dictyostelium purpureum]EGC32977.1 hypothetical protein DICPUDRAFT_81233 [Dictyostelium purpureum]|eukprot:XP_003290495.1 hypothetical protein DICPUDRAFT_81233 [Dictyostelium purpureum]
MAFRGQSNGGSDSLRRRDYDDDEDDGEKKEKLSFLLPTSNYPTRKDIPPLPTVDLHNFAMITSVVKLKNNYPFSKYNLNKEKIMPKDGIERYRYSSNHDSGADLNLPCSKNGYFPYELVVNRKKPKKKSLVSTKKLDDLQKQEGGAGAAEGEEGEEVEEEDDGEEDDGDYGDENMVDDDEDMEDSDDGRDDEAAF